MSWVAYVDESIRTTEGVYILAAAVVDEPDRDKARDQLTRLSQRGMPFHWRLERPQRRSEAIDLVRDLSSLHLVVVGAPVNPRRQERARRQCIETLLYYLEAAGTGHVLLETRNATADRRDIATVDQCRARGVISHAIRVDHARPSEEPLLWLADIVAGAVSAAEGTEPAYRASIEPLVTEYRIQLD